MKINSNINLKDRKMLTLGGFKGLDTLSAKVDVSAIHATEMQNFISRDGVNHKRFGWATQARIRDSKNNKYLAIKGIFNFTIFGIDFLLVYAGKRFWWVKDNEIEDITTKRISKNDNSGILEVGDEVSDDYKVNIDDLNDVECKHFINGDKVYFVGCGDFLVFSEWSNGSFELRRVVGNEDVYIPKTTENIGSEEYGQHHTRITAEEKNILSPYTYNLLFGVEKLNSDSVASYYLDCNDFTDIEVSVEKQGQETIVLTKSAGTGVYNIGDKIKNTEFTLPNIIKSITNSGTVKETAIPHTTTTTEKIKHLDRWYTRQECIDDVYKLTGQWISPYNATGSEEGRACNVTNTFTGEKCGTYQGYLDYLYQKYTGKAPNTSTETVKTTTTTTYSYEYACEITIGITSLITLITMKNDDRLAIRNAVKTYSASTLYGTVDNTDVYYKKPEKISFSLVYIKANGNETVLKTVNEKSVSCSITSVTKNSITADITYSYGKLSCNLINQNAQISEIHLGEYLNAESENLSGKDSLGNKYTGQYSVSEAKLTLNAVDNNTEAYAPLVPNIPNIKVKLTRPFDNSIITTAIKGCIFGALGGSDRLFIVDNTGNTVRWSKDKDFTYFGEKSWCVCGTADKKITGMDRLNDNTLVVAKEYSSKEPSVFIITSKIESIINEAGNTKDRVLFPSSGYKVGTGAIGEVVNFNGDCLMVSNDGLYAIALGENMTVDSRYILHRSRQISNKLEKYDLSKAKCISFNGKLFVAIDGECYVADNKYTASFKGDMQNAINYEWWRWTNIPVSVWGINNNELWFGTEDGQLCKFTDKFYDETKIFLGSGLLSYNTASTDDDENQNIDRFTINQFVMDEINEDDEFLITCDFYDTENNNLKNKPLFIKKDTATDKDGQLYEYLSLYDEKNKRVIGKSVENDNLPSDEFTAIVSQKKTIVANWETGEMDLGTRAYSKTLTFIGITGESNLTNRLKYGIKTRLGKSEFELRRANNDLDFEKLDFETLSLDSQFGSTYTRRLNIRNVNFIQLYFKSENQEDIALNSIQIEFKINKRNIGVR